MNMADLWWACQWIGRWAWLILMLEWRGGSVRGTVSTVGNVGINITGYRACRLLVLWVWVGGQLLRPMYAQPQSMMDKSWVHREHVQSLRHEACSKDRTNCVNKITQSSDSLNELCTRGGRWQHTGNTFISGRCKTGYVVC